ncbi:hypothetical protein G6F57_005398 [Rhizopus arrhizus]|uniref:RRM domain-containing protein n=1 Tax=Rhizopus oryzae TaxID=64495 RepID=A0A9P6XJ09_RHIOR|nr:hypothetical protein G6F24_001517 [Rhizopus arrhizus]KAG1422248.1 hypothetical protein G6F58_003391 [Rhizopus delemar]KAG0915505.1 hypothetical protein G6F33_003274 [Rhizopus arrhizus]KAG0945976.1 hypothetical protein G6F32_006739 [Rhizopus arrhizus]KAG0948266.1 hypothetical protein G6F30_002849 [Rhizopus arrhizus]
MDVDVEAMLDAPYQEKRDEKPVEPERDRHRHSSRSSRHSSRHDSRHRYDYDSRSRSRHRSRYSRSPRRRYSRSPRRRSPRRRSPSREYRRKRSRTPERHTNRRGGRSPSPPVPEEDRDRRTVFVTQLAARLTTREFDAFFSQAGRVREAKIITDRNSRKSKGCGYVEFYDETSVQNALALSGQKLLGIPVLVQLSEAEKNRLAMAAQRNAMGVTTEPLYQRLYIGSLHFSLTENDVRQIFEPFGPLDFVNLHKDPETGRSKGFGFIQYKNANDAKQALEKMNGFELAGRNLKVGLVSEKSGTTMSTFGLDDEETEGLALNSLSRAELMAKLAARDPQNSPPSRHAPAPVLKPNIPTASTRYVMLNNMFNPNEETDPDWVSDLEADIKIECEKYGRVEHIKVNSDSMGEVFLKFDRVGSAEKAISALNGRWFGGKQITAACISDAIYNANI